MSEPLNAPGLPRDTGSQPVRPPPTGSRFRCAVVALPSVASHCLAAAWLAHGFQVERWADFFRALDLPRFLLVLAGTSVVFAGWSAARATSSQPRPMRGGAPASGPAAAATGWEREHSSLPGSAPEPPSEEKCPHSKLVEAADGPEAGAPPRLRLGWLLLVGSLLIAFAGRTPAILAVMLLAVVATELVVPRASLLAPVFQGLARFAVYLAAAATLPSGINGWAIWGGVVLAAFATGVAFVVRQQELRQRFEAAPLLLLAAPLVLTWCMNNGPFSAPALLLGCVLVLWLARGCQRLLRPASGEVACAATELWPALVLVDWLAVADAPRTSALIFVPLFLLAVTLNRLTRRTAVA